LSQPLQQRSREDMCESSYDVIIVSVGVNDITSMTSPAEWRANVTGLLRRIVDHSPGAVIAVAGIPPLGAFPLLPQPLRYAAGQRGLAFDRQLKRVVGTFSQALHVPVQFTPCATRFSADGFHPSPSSYSVFARVFAERIADRLLAGRCAPELPNAVRYEPEALG
ncbi:MAG: SGNH/GDSL hydrolase family protein, partial [Pseudomonadota bacterium]